MLGRRDRSLLVLSELAGSFRRPPRCPDRRHIDVTDGIARVNHAGKASMVAPDANPAMCGHQVWLRVLDSGGDRRSKRTIAPVLKKATRITGQPLNSCRSTRR